jgi:hypothetical protein
MRKNVFLPQTLLFPPIFKKMSSYMLAKTGFVIKSKNTVIRITPTLPVIVRAKSAVY